ncbi:MAG: hypothetical protein IJR33_02455 [Clostridia bacterium]|nr:hypothetical protein [Clostridia bacterium]
MANRILLKRGLVTDIESAVLKYGEIALAFNSDKTKVQAWAGTSTAENGGTEKVLINPDITVPSKVSELANDSGFQTAAEVSTAITTAIAGLGTASFRKVDAVPTAAQAEDNVLYLVMNSSTGHYDIYAKVENEVVLLDDTTVDLSGYVQKEAGKGLSTNDFTTALLNKLNGIAEGANNYVHPASHAASMIDEDASHRFVSDTEKSTWNGKFDSSSTIDGGTF